MVFHMIEGRMVIKKMVIKLKAFLMDLALKDRSPAKLAAAFCMGVYIAFSPFPGFHTAMVFVLSWMCHLNVGVVFASSCVINNPWTMVRSIWPIMFLVMLVMLYLFRNKYGRL